MMRTRQALEGSAVHDDKRLAFSIRHGVVRRGLYSEFDTKSLGFRTLPEADAPALLLIW